MANKNTELLREVGIVLILIGFWMFFVQTNVSPALGSVYIGLTSIAAIIVLADYLFGEKQIPLINPNSTWIGAIAIALIGFAVITYGGQLVISLLSGVPLTGALQLLQSTSPVFSNSIIINFLTFGVFVAYIETYALFIAGLDLLASIFNVSLDVKNLTGPKLWLIIFGISLLFLMLHVTAKGIENQATLILVFFMALVSCLTTVIWKDGRTTILIHVFANSIAMLPTLGISLGI